ncbi:unnamed protein product [Lymnaea stagnalis]|uniref:IRF tryptophan pentad repeat domain-containing protein n=1 Tax=Lymnaea stagnalis TaxID=6523 RepID=A0AAV2HAE9_LYMST
MMMGDSRRPDLRRWLEMMVREGRCQGLTWESEEHKLFRLPWPHQKSRDWKEEDCQILIEWARHTGKYKQGDPLDFPTWKTRIRTAINKNREIKEVPTLHKLEGSNPYKVYRFLPTSPSRTRREQLSPSHPGSDSSPSPTPSVNEVFGQSFKSELSTTGSELPAFQQLGMISTAIPGVSYQYHPQETILSQSLLAGSSYTRVSPQNILDVKDNPLAFIMYIPHQTGDSSNVQSSTEDMDTSDDVQATNLLSTTQTQLQNMHVAGQLDLGLPYNLFNDNQTYHIKDNLSSMGKDTSMPSDLKSIDSLDLIPPIVDGLQKKPDFYLHVQVLYGTTPAQVVNSSRVKTKHCRLFFGSPNRSSGQETGTSAARDEIQMPDFNELPHFDEKQKKKINEALFENEGGEVILTYSDEGDVYAERRCLTRVFCSDGVAESEVVPRTKKNRPVVPSKVFDYTNRFSSELKLHQSDPQHPPPRDHFVLTFGHEILKNDDRPLRVVPVFVVVRHVQAALERQPFAKATVGNALISADSGSFEKVVSKGKEKIDI